MPHPVVGDCLFTARTGIANLTLPYPPYLLLYLTDRNALTYDELTQKMTKCDLYPSHRDISSDISELFFSKLEHFYERQRRRTDGLVAKWHDGGDLCQCPMLDNFERRRKSSIWRGLCLIFAPTWSALLCRLVGWCWWRLVGQISLRCAGWSTHRSVRFVRVVEPCDRYLKW